MWADCDRARLCKLSITRNYYIIIILAFVHAFDLARAKARSVNMAYRTSLVFKIEKSLRIINNITLNDVNTTRQQNNTWVKNNILKTLTRVESD